MIRIILTPVYLLVFTLESLPHHFFFGCALFSLAAITDFFDGKIARKTNQITNFGKLADPVADKMLTTAAYLAFMHYGFCNLWIVMIVLTREFLVTAIRLIASSQGVIIPASIWGKIKTASQMTSIILIMLMGEAINSNLIQGFTRDTFTLISSVLLWVTTAVAVISGLIYLQDSRKVIDYSI